MEILLHAESKCRKDYRGSIPFSEPVKLWDSRVKLYRWAIRLVTTGRGRKKNIRRLTRSVGLPNPLSLCPPQLDEQLEYARQYKSQISLHAPLFRRDLLQKLKCRAEDSDDLVRVKRIRDALRREHTQAMWSSIRCTTAAILVPAASRV
eukprot:scaffold117520_cov80-Cyclotella_meneghiniana.AAC.4